MKRLNLTHVLLFFVLAALVLNLAVMLQGPARAAAADDLDEVVREMDELNYTLKSVSGELDGIQRELSDIADADIFEVRATSTAGATNGIPVVIVDD
jgi:hypothetical protein